ncbi:MAG: class I SAM-dependent rRNA methyltransferase [Myxococcota bacterium]
MGRRRRRERHARPRSDEPTVTLGRKLERVLRQGHPWIWREALPHLDAPVGTAVAVLAPDGTFVARGVVDDGPIGVRVFSLAPRERIDSALFARRIARAAALRDRVIDPAVTDAYRLLHGEGDGLPGHVCDVYGPCAVMRFDGGGAAAWAEVVRDALVPTLRRRGVETLVVRRGRRHERTLEVAFGPAPPDRHRVREHGMNMWVDVMHGQKTGLFLDHRPSRRRLRELSAGQSVLNLYGYTGAFSTAAGLGGAARVVTVDVAGGALALAQHAWADNGLDPARHETRIADVPRYLAENDACFDIIVADPPSFAPRASAVPAALAAYERLHAACLDRLRPGGLYLAASCSSHVPRDTFDATVFAAARRRRRPLQVLGKWGAGEDHPRLPAFVEGDYLKALLVCG